MTDFVVVDASLAVKWVLREPLSEEALALADGWVRTGTVPAAPGLLLAEATNVLHRRVAAGCLSPVVARRSLAKLLDVGIEIRESPKIHVRALELAREMGQPAAYDSHYLALAELMGCDLWTADKKFFNAVRKQTTRLKLLSAACLPLLFLLHQVFGGNLAVE